MHSRRFALLSIVEQFNSESVSSLLLASEFVVNPTKNFEFSTHFWYNYFDKNIQPSMANISDSDTQFDESYRVSVRFGHYSSIGTNRADVGYIRDRLIYNNSIETLTQKIIAQWQIESTLFSQADFIAGFQSQLQYADTESYQNNEFQTDLFWLGSYSISENLSVSLKRNLPLLQK